MNSINNSLLRILMCLTIITGFFPYITVYSFGTDIQPWNSLLIIWVAALLFYFEITFIKTLSLLLLPLLCSLFLLLISDNMFSAIRSLFGYIIIGLSPIVYVYILKRNYAVFVRILKVSTVVYLVVAIIQKIYDTQFLSQIVNRISTTESRGVTSLAAEPTFYGIICLFLILIFNALEIDNKNIYIGILLFQIVLLSQSSMTILFLIVWLSILLVFKLNLKNLFVGLIVITSILYSAQYFESQGHSIRFFSLVGSLLESFSSIFYLDASLNDRLSAIYFSFKGSFNNYLMPNGFGSYANYLNQQLPSQDFFWWVSVSDRIMSYYGAIVFELGLIGLVIPYVYTKVIFNAYNTKRQDLLIYSIFFNFLLFTAIPLTFPFVSIYIASLIYKAHYKFRSTNGNVIA